MAVLRTPQDTTALVTSAENNRLEKTTKPPDEFININLANRKELESLPTIGPVTAKRIIEFRKANGPFKSTDELKKIKGIGEKTLEKIRPYISL
ncbi:MAG: helix-hairpin-helix domain-containing protein [FCB group bacterium]|nr:helix-hairpin-helix domain-containing protein [FCB group bacterium]